MASEIIYAEVRFKNAPPPAAAPAHPKENTPQDVTQKHTQCLPWLIAALFLVLTVSLVIALIVTYIGFRTCQSCEDYEVMRQYLKKRSCVEEEPEGKDSGVKGEVSGYSLASAKLLTYVVAESSSKNLTSGRGWTCCPMGWEPFQASCYYFSNDTMNWDDSARNCTGMGSHLVVINRETEQDFIFTRLNGTVTDSKGKNYYIGLTDPEKRNQWRWVDSTPYNKSSAFWRKGEPNTKDETCTVLHVLGKQNEHGNRNWNDVYCSHQFNRICETAALRF